MKLADQNLIDAFNGLTVIEQRAIRDLVLSSDAEGGSQLALGAATLRKIRARLKRLARQGPEPKKLSQASQGSKTTIPERTP